MMIFNEFVTAVNDALLRHGLRDHPSFEFDGEARASWTMFGATAQIAPFTAIHVRLTVQQIGETQRTMTGLQQMDEITAEQFASAIAKLERFRPE